MSKARRYLDLAKDFPRRKDADGNALCRWCGKALPSRRRSWCRIRTKWVSGSPCQTEAYIRCGMGVRSEVEKRDGGVCSRCGLDMEFVRKRILAAMRAHAGRTHRIAADNNYGYYTFARLAVDRRWRRYLARIGLPRLDPVQSMWEAHHAVAVADGGGGCGVEGYETLCVWCHKAESKSQHKVWAEARKGETEVKI